MTGKNDNPKKKRTLEEILASLPEPEPEFLELLDEYADPKNAEAEEVIRRVRQTGIFPPPESPESGTTEPEETSGDST